MWMLQGRLVCQESLFAIYADLNQNNEIRTFCSSTSGTFNTTTAVENIQLITSYSKLNDTMVGQKLYRLDLDRIHVINYPHCQPPRNWEWNPSHSQQTSQVLVSKLVTPVRLVAQIARLEMQLNLEQQQNIPASMFKCVFLYITVNKSNWQKSGFGVAGKLSMLPTWITRSAGWRSHKEPSSNQGKPHKISSPLRWGTIKSVLFMIWEFNIK